MASAGYVGLFVAYAAGTLNILYISWLAQPALTAGVGAATVIFFFAIATNIGFSTAVSAVVAYADGSAALAKNRSLPLAAIAVAVFGGVVVTLPLMIFRQHLLIYLGLEGEALEAGELYLELFLPTNLLLSFAMAGTAAIRAVGSAAIAMKITLTGALVSIALDPIMIVVLDWGIEGAAFSNWLGRLAHIYVTCRALSHSGMWIRPTFCNVMIQSKTVFAIGMPATIAAIALPVWSYLILWVITPFGDKATAAYLIVDKINTVSFGPLIALSGAIGPIVAQNYIAGFVDRVNRTIYTSLGAIYIYVFLVGALSYIFCNQILAFFIPDQQYMSPVGILFLKVSGLIWIFVALQIVSNAVFQNLGKPVWSAVLSWAQATIGIVPAFLLASWLNDASGAIYGYLISVCCFGLLSLTMLRILLRRLENVSAAVSP